MKARTVLFAIIGVSVPLMMLVIPQVMIKKSPQRVIVVFDSAVNENAQDKLIRDVSGTELKDLNIINGKAVILPDKAAAVKLAKLKGVKYVNDDLVVTINAKPTVKGVATQPAQVLPWGIDRIDAEKVWSTSYATGVKVAVLDTGISLKHPDLINNIAAGTNTINHNKSPNDDNGHGSHVAGIIAASSNSIGVVGVGPSAKLYPVKVLNAAGSGYFSDIIEGLQWAVGNGMQVVNMSFGASSGNQALHDALIATNNAGVTLVAAAGNGGNSSPVIYPAAYSEVIAVAASDRGDHIASFSSAGPEVDLTAPGVGIYSTYKRTGYATLSGTSMASPHIAGAAALVISTKSLTSPADVKARLQTTADLLPGYSSNLQGSGIVDADQAALAP